MGFVVHWTRVQRIQSFGRNPQVPVAIGNSGLFTFIGQQFSSRLIVSQEWLRLKKHYSCSAYGCRPVASLHIHPPWVRNILKSSRNFVLNQLETVCPREWLHVFFIIHVFYDLIKHWNLSLLWGSEMSVLL